MGDIKISDHIRYLGTDIYCDRKRTIASVKEQVKKFLQYLRGKIRSSNLDTQALIFSAYYRSLKTYFMLPLFAAGAIHSRRLTTWSPT